MLDANVSGMVAAFWMAGFVALAEPGGAGSGRSRSAPAFFWAFAAVWSSGSRTALLAALSAQGSP